MERPRIWLLVLALPLIFFGVTRLRASPMERDADDPAPSVVPFPSAAPAAPSPADFDPWQSPIHGVRICIRGLAESTHSSRELYLSWANETTGPTGQERTIRGLNDLREHAENCRKALKDHPLSSDMDEAGKAMNDAIKWLLPVTTEAESYYREARYRQDGMALGRKLHTKLLEAYTAVDRAALRLRTAALLQERKEQAFLRNELYEPARALLEAGLRAPETIDPKQLEAAADRLEKALADSPATSFQRSSAEELLATSRKLLARLREQQPFSASERKELGTSAGHTVRGSPDELAWRYDDFASHHNLLPTCRHYRSQPAFHAR